MLFNNLDNKYKLFVYRIIISLDDISNLNKIVVLLYEEERFLKRDSKKIVIATIIKNKKLERDINLDWNKKVDNWEEDNNNINSNSNNK